MVTEISQADFDEIVLKSKTPILVDFSAKWCGPCKLLEGTLNLLEQALLDLPIVKIDIDSAPELVARYGVRGVPALLLFSNGSVIAQRNGNTTLSTLVKWVGDHR